MYSLKEHNGISSATLPPLLAAKRRRQLYPFFFAMGPVALSITSVLLIGLMAVLYLSQVGQAVTENQQLQDAHAQQILIERQNQDLAYMLSQERSPAYIIEHAKRLGLVPADDKHVQVLAVQNLTPIPVQREDTDP